MDKIDRRFFLASTAAAAALPAFPALAAPSADTADEAMLATIAEALLAEYPENASALGIDKDARAGLKSRLTDRSLAGRAHHAEAARARLARLKGWNRHGLSPAALLDLEVTETAHGLAADGYRFPYGDVAVLNDNWSYRNAPYVVTQNTGAFVEVPDFLDSNHPVKDRADADAYLARVELYATSLDAETERLRHDAGLGAIAPDFLLDKTIRQLKAGAYPADRRLDDRHLAGQEDRRTWAATIVPAPRRWPATRWRRRSTARSRRWSNCAPRPTIAPASGSCRTATLIMPGRCARARPPT